jgi:PBSX family phage terminase large subunit
VNNVKAKYETHIKPFLKDIRKMVLDGSTDKEIYEKLKVSKASFRRWKQKYYDFHQCFDPVDPLDHNSVPENGDKKEKVGRPSDYKEKIWPYLKPIKRMHMQGSTDKEIYEKYKISSPVFYDYKKKFPEFASCFSTPVDSEMAKFATEGLMTRAMGKEYLERTETKKRGPLGDEITIKTVNKWLPPDFQACKYVLEKKAALEWGDFNLIDEEAEDFYELDNIKVVNHFDEWFKDDWNDSKYLYHVLKGGRASGKSTSAARRLIKDILELPINILVVRKVHSTLLESCYEELKQAINDLGVEDEFKCVGGNKFYIRRIKTGQKVIFRGGVEPEKIKSIKTSKYPIARLWIEELPEFKTWDEVKIIVDSVVRANLPENLSYKILLTYNPPKRKNNWSNIRYNTQFVSDNTYVNHSTSFVNPYLSDEFLLEAEAEKLKNENRYRWNYLGEPIGGGLVPFSNLEFREISDEEIMRFHNIIQGIDWGYAINNFHFGRWHFDEDKYILYAIGEINQLKLIAVRAGAKIVEKGWNDKPVVADSSHPESIVNIRTCGIRCSAAIKGPGSVEHGLEWLDSLSAIVIDPKRCPKTAEAFEMADYEIDRDGNPLENLDRKNPVDPIDAIRYATERFQYNKRRF